MYFINRYDAAKQLALRLEKYKKEDGVILAVPRGGVHFGYYLARHFGFPIDLLMTKKIGHPRNKEFAIGAVDLENCIIEERYGIPESYIQKETVRIRKELANRCKLLMGNREPVDIQDKIVIVVDDGIATGRILLATIKMLRKKHPKELVVAVPVSSKTAARRIINEVDKFICLNIPAMFFGVGSFYRNFEQITDEEAIKLLKELNERKLVAW
jgi:putative phosphoribosyl transferase